MRKKSYFHVIVYNPIVTFEGHRYKQVVPINGRWMAFSDVHLCAKFVRYLLRLDNDKNCCFTTLKRTPEEIVEIFNHLRKYSSPEIYLKDREWLRLHFPVEAQSNGSQDNESTIFDDKMRQVLNDLYVDLQAVKIINFDNVFTVDDIDNVNRFAAIDVYTGGVWKPPVGIVDAALDMFLSQEEDVKSFKKKNKDINTTYDLSVGELFDFLNQALLCDTE